MACRRTRIYVDQLTQDLINQAATIMPQGYAIIDLEILNPSNVSDICLSKFVTLLLQFISQRQTAKIEQSKAVHRSCYWITFVHSHARCLIFINFNSSAGCFLCAAPGSKGTKILICCSVNSALPLRMKSFYVGSSNEPKDNTPSDLAQVIEVGRSYSNRMVLNNSDVRFLNTTSVDSILTEAKRVKILSEPTYQAIFSLHETELEKFKLKPKALPDHESQKVVELVEAKELRHRQIGHFMDRFLVSWEFGDRKIDCCCGFDKDSVMEVRHMVDADWLYLSKLSRSDNLEGFKLEKLNAVRESAHRAFLLLKSIPVAARRSLPVLVNPRGQILSIPSVCFIGCQCLKVSAEFSPRLPLGGGHSSFL